MANRNAHSNSEEGSGITAVICDDHPAFAWGLAKLLEEEAADLKVTGIATKGEEAERMVKDNLPDVVLMDIRMPGMDGIETTRAVRSASPTTKVMILTVSDDQADLYAAIRAGASGYVMKDKEVSGIVEAIRSIIRGHLVIPADLAGRFMSDLEETESADLSNVERDILAAIARGETNRDISARLHLSERTVKRRVEDIYQKLHLTDRIEAAIYASKRGFG